MNYDAESQIKVKQKFSLFWLLNNNIILLNFSYRYEILFFGYDLL